MKKLVAVVISALVVILLLAGCAKGDVNTPPSLAADDTAVSVTDGTAQTAAVDTEGTTDASASVDAPAPEDDDLEIMTHIATEGTVAEVNTDSPDTQTVTEENTQAETKAETEEETTEREAIILPFVPAE